MEIIEQLDQRKDSKVMIQIDETPQNTRNRRQNRTPDDPPLGTSI